MKTESLLEGFSLQQPGRPGIHFARALALSLSLLAWSAAAKELPLVAPKKAGLSERKMAEVERFMEKQVAEQKIAGGIVMVSHKGKIGFFHAYGQMDLEAKKPMQPDTIFRLYSMSKAITTASALNLCDAHKLRLEDPVSKYIPSFANLKVATPGGLRAPSRPMTVKDLMLHISGLPYGSGPEALTNAWTRLKPMAAANLEEFAEKLSQVPPAYDPGKNWTSSAATDVLGRVVEVASGESLDLFLRHAIFEPLDMRDTGFSVPAEKLSRFAANYTRTNGLKVIDAPATS